MTAFRLNSYHVCPSLVILGRKRTLAASRAAGSLSVFTAHYIEIKKDGRDRRTDVRPLHYAFRQTRPAS